MVFGCNYEENVDILYGLHIEALKLGKNYTQQLSMGGEYSVEQDHKDIKEQIKSWEQKIDSIVVDLLDNNTTTEGAMVRLEVISHEMMAINR